MYVCMFLNACIKGQQFIYILFARVGYLESILKHAIILHERHATLIDYHDKITMPRASDSYESSIVHQIDLHLR